MFLLEVDLKCKGKFKLEILQRAKEKSIIYKLTLATSFARKNNKDKDSSQNNAKKAFDKLKNCC